MKGQGTLPGRGEIDFPEYRAKLIDYMQVFKMLSSVDQGQMKDISEKSVSRLRQLMKGGPSLTKADQELPKAADGQPPRFSCLDQMRVSAAWLGRLEAGKRLRVDAGPDDLEKQAEAVKQEIIETVTAYQRERMKAARGKQSAQYDRFFITDYIRDSNGKPVYPFFFWKECVEVYLLRFYKGVSQTKMKDYQFATTASGTTGGDKRATANCVKSMVEEVEKLKAAVKNNEFPPRLLYGSKQPRLEPLSLKNKKE